MKWENPGHEYDEIGAIFEKNPTLYLWGADPVTADFAVRAKALNLNVRLVDTSGAWRALGWCGLDAVAAEQVLNAPGGKTILVSEDGQAAKDIFARLEDAGYHRGETCFSLVEFRDNWLSVFAVYVSGKVYFKDISFIPTVKCNLNCEDCLNYTPYLKKMWDEPIERLKSDVDLFFSKVDYIGQFHVSGGEPILYPHLKELLIYIDEHYRPQIHQLAISTNGTQEFSDDVCRVLHDHHVLLLCDDYRDAVPEARDKFPTLITRAERTGVWYFPIKVDRWLGVAPMETNYLDKTEEWMRDFYCACNIPWRELYDGKIYACNYAHYAEKANMTTCDETEYLELAAITEERKKELVELRMGYTGKGYLEFCRRCAGFCNNPYSKQPAKQIPRKADPKN